MHGRPFFSLAHLSLMAAAAEIASRPAGQVEIREDRLPLPDIDAARDEMFRRQNEARAERKAASKAAYAAHLAAEAERDRPTIERAQAKRERRLAHRRSILRGA